MSAVPENYPPFLAELATAIALELRELYPLEEEAAAEIGFKVAEQVRGTLGGIPLYVPKGQAYELAKRDWAIYAKFRGDNYEELALEYNLTAMRIRQIVKACRAEEMRRRQVPLFPEPK